MAVTASSRSSASATIVYAALLDAETWPLWSPYADVEWEVPAGVDRPARVGDLRTCCRERVVEMVADQRFGYEQVAGPTNPPFLSWACSGGGVCRCGSTISRRTPTPS
ncbi:SRPBCC family protein [Streptomyces hydrogenans]|uniref:SRPBCC family protein n=1 Tax=Streptomyces hydrogenans TaxID=1873719 RepID=UPI0035E0C531